MYVCVDEYLCGLEQQGQIAPIIIRKIRQGNSNSYLEQEILS